MSTSIRFKRKVLTKDDLFILLAAVMLCHTTLFSYFAVIISKLPVISVAEPFFFPVLYGILVVLSVNRKRTKYIRITDFLILLFFAFAILITMLCFPQNESFILNDMFSDILPCIPFFFLGLCLELDEKTDHSISMVCCIAIIVSVLYMFFFLETRELGGSHGDNYSMYWSYLLLPNTMIVINYAFKSKKIAPVLCSILGIVYAFAMGTRGVIVIIFAMIAINFWRYKKTKTWKKILLLLLSGGLIFFFYMSPLYMQALKMFQGFLSDLGVSTRVVDYLIKGEMISYTSGRNDIYAALINYLNRKPILGYGVYGEYPLGYPAGAHNAYLQVLFNFGCPLGILLITAYLIVFIIAYIKGKNTISQNWIIMFGCIVFIRSIFGGGYFSSSVFFLLGMCLRSIRKSSVKKYKGDSNG